MADIGVSKNWLASPTKEVEGMWRQVQIQERRSAIAAAKRSLDEQWQKIEDIKKGHIIGLNARIKMLELEIKRLEAEENEPIDVNK